MRLNDRERQLTKVIDVLNQVRTRATYEAVAGLLGLKEARGLTPLMSRRAVRPYNSWVVNTRTGKPTGYPPEQMAEGLLKTDLIKNSDELEQLLDK